MADMLSRARFDDEDDMVSKNEEVGVDFFDSTRVTTKGRSTSSLNEFNEDEYEREWLQINRFLRTLSPDVACTKGEANRIWKKAYHFFLWNRSIWKHMKKRNGIPLRIVTRREEQMALLSEYHESPWSGHYGTWATFEKLKEKYWWPGMYRDAHHFVTTCESCQIHSAIWHRYELHPTYPPTVHFKWMMDLVTMPMGLGQMRYLVLAREDLTNKVEGRHFRTRRSRSYAGF